MNIISKIHPKVKNKSVLVNIVNKLFLKNVLIN